MNPLVMAASAGLALALADAGRPSRACEPATAGVPASMPATGPSDKHSVPTATVDPRVELLSIVFRLAGNSEYNTPRSQSAYAREVEAHFAPFANHAAIQAARRLRDRRGISYDAVMSMAVHLSEPPDLRERVAFDERGVLLDSRWSPADARDFVGKLRLFTKESRFVEFFGSHEPLYRAAAESLAGAVGARDLHGWFDAYFGTRSSAELRLVVGMLTGGGCYGCRIARPDGTLEMYSIIGAWQFDRQGIPRWDSSVTLGVVHEYGHSYCNPLADRHMADLQAAGDRLFASRARLMRSQAYSNGTTVIYESLVRAVTVRYVHDTRGALAAKVEAMRQADRGFTWVGELADVLARYEEDRDTYRTLEAFMPQVITFFDAYAANVKEEKEPGLLERLFSTTRPKQ